MNFYTFQELTHLRSWQGFTETRRAKNPGYKNGGLVYMAINIYLVNKKCHGDNITSSVFIQLQKYSKGGNAEANVFKMVRYGPWDIIPAQIVTNQDNVIFIVAPCIL